MAREVINNLGPVMPPINTKTLSYEDVQRQLAQLDLEEKLAAKAEKERKQQEFIVSRRMMMQEVKKKQAEDDNNKILCSHLTDKGTSQVRGQRVGTKDYLICQKCQAIWTQKMNEKTGKIELMSEQGQPLSPSLYPPADWYGSVNI